MAVVVDREGDLLQRLVEWMYVQQTRTERSLEKTEAVWVGQSWKIQ